MRRREQWVAVSPCSIQENVTLEKCSTMMVTVAPRGQFSFKENIGSMVRMTKWTGRDYVGCIHIKPQIVTIDENLDLQIEVENPYPEKKLYLRKHDNISCLSILTSPIPSALFSSINSSSADKYEDGNKRWFKVTSVVLHKKGMQFIHLVIMDVIIIVFITTLYFFILNVDIVALNKVRKISMVKFYTLVIQRKLFCLTINFLFILTLGRLDRITIQPGRTMKIIATVLGPLKKYVGEIPNL